MHDDVGSTASGSPGIAVEAHVRAVAARLGIADLVMIPLLEPKGGAVREVTDGCLVAVPDGAILQVKSREPNAAALDTPEKAAAWIRKQVGDAIRQGRGSRRRLCDPNRPVQMLPVRAFEVAETRRAEFARTMPDAADWPIVVVVDHPAAPPIKLQVPDDVLVLTLDDWRELHRAVRSVTGIVTYVRRVLAARPTLDVRLGGEAARFAVVCDADERAPGSPLSVPWFSRAAIDDPPAADFYGHLMNRMWPSDSAFPLMRTGDYLPALEFMDAVAPTMRVLVGRRWLGYLEDAVRGQRSGFAVTPGGPLVSLFERRDDEGHEERFAGQLMELTIHRALAVARLIAPCPALGVGALLQVDHVDYVFVFLPDAGALPPQSSDLAALVEETFGSIPEDQFRAYRAG